MDWDRVGREDRASRNGTERADPQAIYAWKARKRKPGLLPPIRTKRYKSLSEQLAASQSRRRNNLDSARERHPVDAAIADVMTDTSQPIAAIAAAVSARLGYQVSEDLVRTRAAANTVRYQVSGDQILRKPPGARRTASSGRRLRNQKRRAPIT